MFLFKLKKLRSAQLNLSEFLLLVMEFRFYLRVVNLLVFREKTSGP